MSTQKVRPDQGFTERQEFRQRRRVRNRKLGTYAVVAAMVVVGGFAIVSTQQADGDGQQPANTTDASTGADPTVTTHWYQDIATGERSRVAIDMSGARLLEASPNGKLVAYNTCCNDDQIYVANLDGSGTEIITPAELDGYGPTWIDDDTFLFQGRPERTIQLGDLYVADLSSGDITMVVDLPNERNGAWIVISDVSPDGTTVLYHLPRGKGEEVTWDLWTVPLAGGEPTLLRRNAGFAQYATDGSIVFLDHPVPFQGDAIWIMDGGGTDARPLVEHQGDALAWPRVSPDGTMVAYGHDGTVEWVDIVSGNTTTIGVPGEESAWYGNDKLIV